MNDRRPDTQNAIKVFLLASMAGLRRKEIDLLEWSAFCWSSSVIRVERTQHFTPKTIDSTGDVAVDDGLIRVFRQYRDATPAALFVVESDGTPPTRGRHNAYRCESIFRRLTKWLQANGVESTKPIHELRKAFGSAINERGDIHQASRSLRHSDIRVTSSVYVDSKSRVAPGLGHLLE